MPKLTPEQRAAVNRANGAKSRGPKTPAGRARCAQAARDSRRPVSLECTLLPHESRDALHSFAAAELAYWRPSSPSELQLVHELIDINWRVTRLRYTQTASLLASMESQRLASRADSFSPSMAAQAELDGSLAHGDQDRLDRRIARLLAMRSRLTRDLERAKRRAISLQGSQPPLETQYLPDELSWRVPTPPSPSTEPAEDPDPDPEPEPGSQPGAPGLAYTADPDALIVPAPDQPEPPADAPTAPAGILAWTRNSVGFTPDPFQAELIASTAKNIMVLGGRQTGKSTAAAVRVAFEAIHHPGATILLAGPTGRQSGQIMEKARAIVLNLGHPTAAPPPGCGGFRLPNGSAVIALPDSEATVRGFSAPRLIVVDEAAFASDELFHALQPMLAVSNGTLMLLSTPAGRSGFFFDQWHDQSAAWHRIQCRAVDCARITPEALDNMRRMMSSQQFAREFECVFTAEPDQFITEELFDSAVRHDIEPLFLDLLGPNQFEIKDRK